MNLKLVERIVNALLYEGYILYPYRASAVKNRQRWNFGVIYPQDYSLSQGGAEASSMQTECLLSGDQRGKLDVKIRFLNLLERWAVNGRRFYGDEPLEDDDAIT